MTHYNSKCWMIKNRKNKTILLFMLLLVLLMVLTMTMIQIKREANELCRKECAMKGMGVAYCTYSLGFNKVNVEYTCLGYNYIKIPEINISRNE